mmetsp:Transcript_37715/g.117280  ORF Transcript_37715/g.117280 Transcript_37715/m.117280 type:complete len:322 (-) Transcript_37715:94-1059(-)
MDRVRGAPQLAAVAPLHGPHGRVPRLEEHSGGGPAVDGSEGDLAGLLEVVLQLLPSHAGVDAVHEDLVHEVRRAVQLHPQDLVEQHAPVERDPCVPSVVCLFEADLAVQGVLEPDHLVGLPDQREVVSELLLADPPGDALHVDEGLPPPARVVHHPQGAAAQHRAVQLFRGTARVLLLRKTDLVEERHLEVPLHHGSGGVGPRRRLRPLHERLPSPPLGAAGPAGHLGAGDREGRRRRRSGATAGAGASKPSGARRHHTGRGDRRLSAAGRQPGQRRHGQQGLGSGAATALAAPAAGCRPTSESARGRARRRKRKASTQRY